MRKRIKNILKKGKAFTRSFLYRARFSGRLKEEIRKAETILFVCGGNKYRSPFAEKYAAQVLPKSKKISSAGFLIEGGEKSPDSAIEVAREYGIDLSSHSARKLLPEDLEAADLIFIFERSQYEWFQKHYPAYLRKVFFLACLLPYAFSSLDLGDHHGRNIPEVRKIFFRIRLCLQRIKIEQKKEIRKDAENRKV